MCDQILMLINGFPRQTTGICISARSSPEHPAPPNPHQPVGTNDLHGELSPSSYDHHLPNSGESGFLCRCYHLSLFRWFAC